MSLPTILVAELSWRMTGMPCLPLAVVETYWSQMPIEWGHTHLEVWATERVESPVCQSFLCSLCPLTNEENIALWTNWENSSFSEDAKLKAAILHVPRFQGLSCDNIPFIFWPNILSSPLNLDIDLQGKSFRTNSSDRNCALIIKKKIHSSLKTGTFYGNIILPLSSLRMNLAQETSSFLIQIKSQWICSRCPLSLLDMLGVNSWHSMWATAFCTTNKIQWFQWLAHVSQ